MAASIEQLIALLEKATGNSWDLDRAIFEAVHFPTEIFGSKVESWARPSAGGRGYTINTVDGYRHLDACNAPNYTASIDAALTLVPPQCWGEISWSGVLGIKENPRSYPIVTLGPGEDGHETQAATIPLALCIAALKARLQQSSPVASESTP